MEEYATEMQKLARLLARVLVTNLGHNRGVLDDICDESTCFLRLNRYPICPIAPEIFGLVPHTDSDFLTILHQDEVGGLQLMKDSKWVAVIPNQDALIVNIGDLFQVISLLQDTTTPYVKRLPICQFLCSYNIIRHNIIMVKFIITITLDIVSALTN